MSNPEAPRKYITREELHRENANDERAICAEHFNQIFKVNRKLDERGFLCVNFQTIANGGEHIPELYQNRCFEEIVTNLVKFEDIKLSKVPGYDRGLNALEFYEANKSAFLACEEELDYMFDDLRGKDEYISFEEIHDLMHSLGEECAHSNHTMDDLKNMVLACGGEKGLDRENFKKLMLSTKF